MSLLEQIEIPDKTYFKIGEVAKLLDLEPYVLRYWEGEFDVLDPDKTDSGQRIYQREDIELVCQIQDLLYNQMFTIAGARRQLDLEREGKPNFVAGPADATQDEPGNSAEVERLEAENAELREQIEALNEQVAHAEVEETQTDMWEEKIASQRDEIARLEAQLERAGEQIDQLEAARAERPDSAGVDPEVLRSLRKQVEGLARLARRPS